jgi:hypothetical protein
MKLYTVIIDRESCSGDTHSDIVGVFTAKEKAQEIVDKFNDMNLKGVANLGWPIARFGHEIEVDKPYINFEELEKYCEADRSRSD